MNRDVDAFLGWPTEPEVSPDTALLLQRRAELDVMNPAPFWRPEDVL